MTPVDYTKLCVYDLRNPEIILGEEYGVDEEESAKYGEFSQKDCYCDNCFYGRSKLTEQLIEYSKIINQKENDINKTRK